MAESSKPLFAYVNAREFLAAAIALPVVCVCLVALRLYTRRIKRQQIHLDDWLSLAGVVFLIGMGIVFIIGYAQGAIGRPMEDYDGEDMMEYLSDYDMEARIQWSFQLILMLCYGCVKLSIAFFHRRIFIVDTRSPCSYISWMIISIIIAWTLVFFFLQIFSCETKVYLNWTPAPTDLDRNKCKYGTTQGFVLLISDMVIDFIVLLLPIPSVCLTSVFKVSPALLRIWRLNLELGCKLRICFVLLIGLATVAASITRVVVFTFSITKIDSPAYNIHQLGSAMCYWAMIEASFGLIASCLPPLSLLCKAARTSRCLEQLRIRSPWEDSEAHLRRISYPERQEQAEDINHRTSHSMSLDFQLESCNKSLPRGNISQQQSHEARSSTEIIGYAI